MKRLLAATFALLLMGGASARAQTADEHRGGSHDHPTPTAPSPSSGGPPGAAPNRPPGGPPEDGEGAVGVG